MTPAGMFLKNELLSTPFYNKSIMNPMDNKRPKVGLDNPLLKSRLRGRRMSVIYSRPHAVSHMPSPSKPVPHPPAQTEAPKPIQTIADLPLVSTKPEAPASTAQVINNRPDLPKQSRSHVLKRQMVRPSSNKKYRPKHRRPLMPIVLKGMALIIFVAGIGVTINTISTNKYAKNQITRLTEEAEKSDVLGISNTAPSETAPSNILTTHTVADDAPRFLVINKLGVKARIQRIGITQDNALKSPTTIFDAGWYQGSAKPGEVGPVVLNGHVSGPTKHGIFHSIGSVKAGDKIQVERGDGKVFTYTVAISKTYDDDKVDMTEVLASYVPDKPGLNLITTSSPFNVVTNKFEPRIVIFATQDES